MQGKEILINDSLFSSEAEVARSGHRMKDAGTLIVTVTILHF